MGLVVFAAALVLTCAAFSLLARHVRRRGLAGGGVRGALAAYEEFFHATGHERYVAVAQEQQRTATPGAGRRSPPAAR
jgi:hypothetical protein